MFVLCLIENYPGQTTSKRYENKEMTVKGSDMKNVKQFKREI